ncbi:MAG: glycosyltransferase [Rhodothermales bacterium]
MPSILHVIENMDAGGATRAAITTARASARLGGYAHRIAALGGASDEAKALARQAGVDVLDAPDTAALHAAIEAADIVQIECWNAPGMMRFLHTAFPACRLAMWHHVAGTSAPQLISPALAEMADLTIACNPFTYETNAVFQQLPEERRAMVLAPADLDRVRGVAPRPHQGFNVGYIGTVSFVKMHPDYVPMSASIQIPGVRFVVCGDGIQAQLKQQAAALGAADRFDFRGYVADIAPVLETMDVYGYPLCEETYAAAELNLQEVMYASVPPVVFPYGGVVRLVEHEQTGMIVDSAAAYREAIEYLYHNPDERLRMGRNAAAHARMHFGAENAAVAMNACYERLLAQPKRPHAWPGGSGAALSGAQLLADSLGDAGADLRCSLAGGDTPAVLEAERRIGASSFLMYNSGFFRYGRHAPQDTHLRLWSGLYLEAHGSPGPALNEYAQAFQGGLQSWRIQWYFARTLRALGEHAKARPIYEALRRTVADFDALTGDDAYLEQPAAAVKPAAPRVTALVSTYKSEAFMEGCLDNLVNQTLYKQGGLEIVVIDAASPENERAIVERFQQSYPGIRYERAAEREPLYASWNRGIRMAAGPYLTSANTDDRHRADALETMADCLDASPEIALVYPGQIDTSVPNETFATTSSKKLLDWPPYTYRELERHCIIGSQPMWRKRLHATYGLFREEFISAGDYEFWLRVGKHEPFYRHPETLGLYFRNPAGIEHGAATGKRETIRIWEEYGMFERGVLTILDGQLFTRAHIARYFPEGGFEPTRPLTEYITLFQQCLAQRDIAQAARIADQAVRSFPKAPYPFVLRAITSRMQGQFGHALEAIEASLKLEESPEALYELIQTSLATQHRSEAVRTGEYLRERYPAWAHMVESMAL